MSQRDDEHASERPPEFWGPLRRGPRARALAFAVSVCALFMIARWLTPDGRALGTHEQLGLAPCRMLSLIHVPCPFCGMTTAFAHMARGQIWSALKAQPAGAALFMALAAAAGAASVCAVSGRYPRPLRYVRLQGRVVAAIGAFAVFAWMYKIVSVLR